MSDPIPNGLPDGTLFIRWQNRETEITTPKEFEEKIKRLKQNKCGYKQPCGWCSLFDSPCNEVCGRKPVSK